MTKKTYKKEELKKEELKKEEPKKEELKKEEPKKEEPKEEQRYFLIDIRNYVLRRAAEDYELFKHGHLSPGGFWIMLRLQAPEKIWDLCDFIAHSIYMRIEWAIRWDKSHYKGRSIMNHKTLLEWAKKLWIKEVTRLCNERGLFDLDV